MSDDMRDLNRRQTISETDSFTPDRYRQFARYLRDGSRVLDVGCNTGRGGAVLRQLHPDIRLVGAEMLESRLAAIPSGVYDELTSSDLQTLAERGEQYDAIIMGEVIEHVPYSDLEAFIHAARTLLVNGGLLVLSTPNPHYLLLKWRGGSVLGGAHVSVHCACALSELLSHSGFEVTDTKGTGRISRVLGRYCPLTLYGSYLMVAGRTPTTPREVPGEPS